MGVPDNVPLPLTKPEKNNVADDEVQVYALQICLRDEADEVRRKRTRSSSNSHSPFAR
jgi:hypothetical protein